MKSSLWITLFKTVQNKFDCLNVQSTATWNVLVSQVVHRPGKYGRGLRGTRSLRPVAGGKAR